MKRREEKDTLIQNFSGVSRAVGAFRYLYNVLSTEFCGVFTQQVCTPTTPVIAMT